MLASPRKSATGCRRRCPVSIPSDEGAHSNYATDFPVGKVVDQLLTEQGVELRFQEKLMGSAALAAAGVPLPDETLEAARGSDAVLLGAIGGHNWDNNEKHLKPETGLLQLRAGLGLFANLRPSAVLLVDASTLKKEVAEGVDIMVVRELTGAIPCGARIYFGKPRGFGTNDKGEDIGFNTEVYSASEVTHPPSDIKSPLVGNYFQIVSSAMIDRIARVAFEVARKRRGKLCSVDKVNVPENTKASMLWRKRVTALASEFPDIELSHIYVDNAAMPLVRNPEQFDTIVTNNIFGDILSDEASILITGSIGMLPSASVGESGPGLFEPIHGSAPDIAGQDKANPLATILGAAMLLRYGLGEENAAKRIELAVTETLDHGLRTGDIYSPGTVIDACTKGNLGRFINHSCSPNCRREKWMVNGEVCIGIFAMRSIKKVVDGTITQDDAEVGHFEEVVADKDSKGNHADIAKPDFSVQGEDLFDCPAANAELEPLQQHVGILFDTDEPSDSLEAWSPKEDEDVLCTPVHVSGTIDRPLKHFPVHGTQSSDHLQKAPNGPQAPDGMNGSTSSDFVGNLVPGFNANKRNNLKQHRNPKPSSSPIDNEHILGVEGRLNNLLDGDGGISKRKDATNGYLKLLFLTAVEGDSAGVASQRHQA
ncbi:hypothetical protein ACP4OV_005711 [Aristida adscensionis]